VCKQSPWEVRKARYKVDMRTPIPWKMEKARYNKLVAV